ncbi:efflux RND transporter periplasmic adaptor subunit [Ramlibacter solisilvae]|uniref:Hemolysin D n=1 Tax=Ramlibacter tataouinensis TaxID=94132 RepID=A0A127JV37_9BURK|nr:efflux RND transporter periplasmic adaptor subunit [Ramlibacter tataouinensis]AMO21882.1 hemolysin D [Ramlibacter tataouinensis]
MSYRQLMCVAALVPIALAGGCGGGKKAPAAGPMVAEVTTVTVQSREVPYLYEFVGQTESSQQVEIRARVEGFLEKRMYTEGTPVKPGQVMFVMDKKPFQAALQAAEGELAQQKARLTTARANLNRVRPLVQEDALAKKELDDAQGQEQAAAAAVESAQAKVINAKLNLGYTTITAPVAGLSSFAKVQDGAYVNAQNSLLTYVAKLDPMRVNFSVSENETLRLRSDLSKGRLKPSQDDKYMVDVVLADGSTFPTAGRITFADAAFSETTGTFLIRAELPNPQGTLRPGQFVRVKVRGFSRLNAIIVPQVAMQEGPRGTYVWIVGPDGKAAQRTVEAGVWMGDNWLVDSGLKDGEHVIVGGFLKLAPGVAVKETPAAASPASAPASAAAAAAGASGTKQ